jgi:hypothetical protein
VQKPFHPFVNWKEHGLLSVFVKYVFPNFLTTLETAVSSDQQIRLSSETRVLVAKELISIARKSIDAITVVERDEWLFSTDSSMGYLAANIAAAKRLKGKARRLVVLKSKKRLLDKKISSTLDALAAAQFHLRWIEQATMERVCAKASFSNSVDNALIVDGNKMSESSGTAHDGHYTVASNLIQKVQQRFDYLRPNATHYS